MNMTKTVVTVVLLLISVSGMAGEENQVNVTKQEAEQETKPLLFEGTFFLVNSQGDKRVLPHAHVSITTGDNPIFEVETNEEGQIFVNNLPEGNYVVLVESEQEDVFGTFEIVVIYGDEIYNDLFAAEFYLEREDDTDQAMNMLNQSPIGNTNPMMGRTGCLFSPLGLLGAATALGVAIPLALIEESPARPK